VRREPDFLFSGIREKEGKGVGLLIGGGFVGRNTSCGLGGGDDLNGKL